MKDAPINTLWFPPDPNRTTLSESARGIDVKIESNLDGLGGIVTTRVGRRENSDRSAGTTRAKAVAVADLRLMWRDKKTQLRKCGEL
jgi:hypothetical protein